MHANTAAWASFTPCGEEHNRRLIHSIIHLKKKQASDGYFIAKIARRCTLKRLINEKRKYELQTSDATQRSETTSSIRKHTRVTTRKQTRCLRYLGLADWPLNTLPSSVKSRLALWQQGRY